VGQSLENGSKKILCEKKKAHGKRNRPRATERKAKQYTLRWEKGVHQPGIPKSRQLFEIKNSGHQVPQTNAQ